MRTVLDCGLFHTFDGDERPGYVASLASVTEHDVTDVRDFGAIGQRLDIKSFRDALAKRVQAHARRRRNCLVLFLQNRIPGGRQIGFIFNDKPFIFNCLRDYVAIGIIQGMRPI